MGLMSSSAYETENPWAAAINGLREGFNQGTDREHARQKQESDLVNQELVRTQQQQLIGMQMQEAQRKQTEYDMQQKAQSDLQTRLAPRQLVDGGGMPTALGEGLLPPEFKEQFKGPYADPRQAVQQVSNPAWGETLSSLQDRKEVPALPLTQAELLKYGVQGDANMNAAIGHYQTAQGNDAKLENLREMLTLKNQYAVEMATAKNEFQQQAIKDKFDNALALQAEKYDLLKGVKMAGVRGGSSKAPMGYRYNGDMLEPIPGGPADQKGQDRAKAAEGASLMLDSTIGTLNELMTHPGRKGATGTIKTAFIPGTDAADWAAKLDTFKAQTFLPMVQSMKGMGALSDAEGKKLTEAVGALDRSRMSEKGIYDSMTNIMKELEAKRALANKYAPQAASPAAATSSTPKVGEMRGGYMYMGGDPSNRNSWGKR